ncbi:unnamed protein product, partial [Effrenium voratum]
EIQERLGLEQEAGPQDLDAFFGRLASVQCLNTPVVGREMAELDLSQILEGMSLWPPELSPADRDEVLAALQARIPDARDGQ